MAVNEKETGLSLPRQALSEVYKPLHNTNLEAARTARQHHRTIKRFSQLKEDRQALHALLGDRSGDLSDQTLQEWSAELDSTYERLGGSLGEKLAEEGFRLAANTIIRNANEYKRKKAVAAGLIAPESSSLIGRSQIPPKPHHIAVRERSSPTRPHADLGDLTLFRKGKLPPHLNSKLHLVVLKRHPDNYNAMSNFAVSVASLLPNHVLNIGKDTPNDLLSVEKVAHQIVDTLHLMGEYMSGTLVFPTKNELAKASGDKLNKLLEQLVQTTLTSLIYFEVTNPNLEELKLKDEYVRMSKFIQDKARWITNQREVKTGQEVIKEVIEKMPEVQASILISRFSLNLYRLLGMPRPDLISSRRFAEFIRMAAYNPTPAASETAKSLMETLKERMNLGDINTDAICEELSSLPNCEDLLLKFIVKLDPESTEVFEELMHSTGILEDLDFEQHRLSNLSTEEDYEDRYKINDRKYNHG